MSNSDQLLKAIGDLIDVKLTKNLESIKKNQDVQGQDIKALKQGLKDQSQDIKEQGQDIKNIKEELNYQGKDIMALKEGQEETDSKLNKMDRKLNSLQKDIKLVLKYHDEMHIVLRSRI